MKSNITRRNFIRSTAVTSGLAAVVPVGMAERLTVKTENENTTREIWVAGVSQMNLHAETPELMVEQIIEILKGIIPYKPDFV